MDINPDVFSSVLTAGTSLFAASRARSDQKKAMRLAENEKKNALALLERAGSTDALFQALQEAQLKSGHQKALAGYSGARRATELGADAARRTVLNQGQQLQAQATQGLVSQGLIGTSVGRGAASDLAGQTTAQLANIDQQLASAFASLGIEQGQLQQDQSAELAGLIGSGRQYQQQLGLTRAEYAPANLETNPLVAALIERAKGGSSKTAKSSAQSDYLAKIFGKAQAAA